MKKIAIDARESGTSTGRYIDKLIEYLYQIRPNYKIVVLTTKSRYDFMKKLAPKFEIIVSPFKEFTFSEQIGFLKQIRVIAPDLMHFGIVQQPILYRGKVVTTMHDLTTIKFRNPSKNWLLFTLKQQVYKWVNKIAARKSVIIIAVSEYTKDAVAKFAHINSRKIVVTYEAADKITDPAEGPVDVSHESDAQFIMYVGRPTPHKNLERLIEAFVMLKQTHPDIKLVLAGKKDILYKRIRRNVEAAGINDVIFTGFISEGQLKWLYEHCSAYVFPSLSEGFGLPGLEAMIHGAPVVSSNATSLPEIYGDAAEYFDPTDSFDMASAIARVIDDPKRAAKLRELGATQAAKYSWRRMAEQTAAVYKEVLGD
jgi:glycosyltransferase involved in cell wall biosynthesis